MRRPSKPRHFTNPSAICRLCYPRFKSPTTDDVEKISQDAARILVAGILAAPVTPDFFSQVAAHMITASQTSPFDGTYKSVLNSAFIRRGILSLQASRTVSSIQPKHL